MIILLSPAKSLDFESPISVTTATLPDFLDRSQRLVERLRHLSPPELASLMGISDSLAALNAARYDAWTVPYPVDQSRQAILAFNGDVYEGLDARAWPEDDLIFAQTRLRILSGLYGLLRPLDRILPYRLEMGIRLDTPDGKDLYAFWGDRLTDAVNETVRAAQASAVVNLASVEYFKAVKPKRLSVPVIQPVFEDWSGGRFKVVSFYAKRARGLMARFAVERRCTDPTMLQAFDSEGYAFTAEASDKSRWVFRRRVD